MAPLIPCTRGRAAYPLPFVIEWHESDDIRREGLIARGALPSTGQSPYRLSAVHSSVTSIQSVQEQIHAYFGLTADAAPLRGEFGDGVCISLGGVSLWFWERPGDISSKESPDNGLDTNLPTDHSLRLQRPFQIDVERRESEMGAGSTAPFTSGVVELHGLRVRFG